MTSAVRTVVGSMRRKGCTGKREHNAISPQAGLGAKPLVVLMTDRLHTVWFSSRSSVWWLTPRRNGCGRVDRAWHGRRQAVGSTVVVAAVVAGRVDSVARRLRVDEVTTL